MPYSYTDELMTGGRLIGGNTTNIVPTSYTPPMLPYGQVRPEITLIIRGSGVANNNNVYYTPWPEIAPQLFYANKGLLY